MDAVSRSAITLDQVARLAGVSRATASRVFTGNPAVSREARSAVERAAAELGYIPNQAARSLAGGRSASVGVVVPDPRSSLFLDPLFPRLLLGIGEELSANGLQMVLFAPQSPTDVQRLEQYLAGGHVDAVILLTLHDSDTLSARLQSRGIPVVYGGRPRGRFDVSFVDVDNHAGGRSATEDLVEHADMDRDSGEMAMARLLALGHEVDAVFAATDAMAAGAMWALQVLGRRVPDDVAVIGFDDSPIATATRPPLSSVKQPVEDMGREMARFVLGPSARDRTTRQLILSPELAVRESTVAAR
jgi:DNA-binding LacI/PurR family transcriptional regulator